MVGAGLMAQKATRSLASPPERGSRPRLAPGSKVVTAYLERAGLLAAARRQLGFEVVGYGCTTCIGNAGPLPPADARSVEENDAYFAAVLSGNRNFEARVHNQVRANYLASPMLVVAYALAGPDGPRPDPRAPRDRAATGRPCTSATSGPRRAPCGPSSSPRSTRRCSRTSTARSPSATPLGPPSHSRGTEVPVGPGLRPTCANRPYFSLPTISDSTSARSSSTARGSLRSSGTRSRPTTSPPPATSRRQSRRASPRRARGPARRVQHLRHPEGEPRSPPPRHVRERSAEEPAGGRQGRRVHDAPARRPGHDHLRGVPRLPDAEDPSAGPRREGLRAGKLARLGGEGSAPPWCPGGDRPELRADPPRQPRRDGRPSPRVPGGQGGRRARPHGPGDVPGERPSAGRPLPCGASSRCGRPRTSARPGHFHGRCRVDSPVELEYLGPAACCLYVFHRVQVRAAARAGRIGRRGSGLSRTTRRTRRRRPSAPPRPNGPRPGASPSAAPRPGRRAARWSARSRTSRCPDPGRPGRVRPRRALDSRSARASRRCAVAGGT